MAGGLDEFGVLGLDDLLGDEDVEADLADCDDLLSVGGVLAACKAGDGEESKDGAFHGVRCGFGVKIKTERQAKVANRTWSPSLQAAS